MELVKQEITRTSLGNRVVVDGLKVQKDNYTLVIQNDHGDVAFSFFKCGLESPLDGWSFRKMQDTMPDYQMTVHEGMIQFQRHVFRPNHDHDNWELLVQLEPPKEDSDDYWKIMHERVSHGVPQWVDRVDYQTQTYLVVAFGPVTVDY